MSDKKDDLTGENVHGIKQRFQHWNDMANLDPFVKKDEDEPVEVPEPAPEPAPEPVVVPEPVEPEKPAEDDEVLSAAKLNLMAKHYRKVHGVAFVVAKQTLLDDPELLEEYKNLKKW